MKHWRTWALLTAALIVAVLYFAAGARAQVMRGVMACDLEAAMLAMIKGKYGERAERSGLAGTMLRVTLYRNLETGTWSMLAVNAQGLACIIGAGTDMQDVKPELGKPL